MAAVVLVLVPVLVPVPAVVKGVNLKLAEEILPEVAILPEVVVIQAGAAVLVVNFGGEETSQVTFRSMVKILTHL